MGAIRRQRLLLPRIFAVHSNRRRRSGRNSGKISVDRIQIPPGHVPECRPRHDSQEAVLRVKRIVTGSQRALELFQRQSSGFAGSVWRYIGRRDATHCRRRAKIYQRTLALAISESLL
jgi:hypothetical protein